jgi:SAM-dependent methyltransferase
MQSAQSIRDANVRYHDLAAEHYDSKWGITYGDVAQAQVEGKLRKALGHEPRRYARALEIGAGTGYFSLNLLRAGVVAEAVATDISPGMLRKLEDSARELGLRVDTEACDAVELPFEDDSFDLVFGHAVLHHLPDLDAAFREFSRVLGPGGVVAFCGEPSYYGDRIAALPKRGAQTLAPLWRALMGARPRPPGGHHHDGWSEEDRLEQVVDVHASRPRSWRATPSWPDSTRSGSAARSSPRACSAGQTGRWRPRPTRSTCPGHGASTPTAAISSCNRSTARCWSHGCRRRSSTTC